MATDTLTPRPHETLTVGERIRRLRRTKGWRQVELAAEGGVTRHTVAMWEPDCYLPKVVRLFDLARALGVSMDYVLTGEREGAS